MNEYLKVTKKEKYNSYTNCSANTAVHKFLFVFLYFQRLDDFTFIIVSNVVVEDFPSNMIALPWIESMCLDMIVNCLFVHPNVFFNP